MKQVTDTGAIEKAVDEIIAANPDKVEQAKAKPTLAWLVRRPGDEGHAGQGQPAGRFPDVRKIRLEVEEANDRAIAFYEREGFKRTGTTPDCGVKGSGIPAVIMEKVIW
jgi:hypothetical protein